MYLYINTANHKNLKVSVMNNNSEIVDSVDFFCEHQFQIQNKLLKKIDKIFKKNKIILNKLKGIFIVNKSREMTSLRIGISIANGLAYGLHIPIFAVGGESYFYKNLLKKKNFTPIKPEYEINPMLKT